MADPTLIFGHETGNQVNFPLHIAIKEDSGEVTERSGEKTEKQGRSGDKHVLFDLGLRASYSSKIFANYLHLKARTHTTR